MRHHQRHAEPAGPDDNDLGQDDGAILAIIAGVEDINLLSSQQFKAKSKELAGLSSNQLVNGDQKVFKLKNNATGKEFKVGFAVVETTDDAVIMDRKAELLPEVLAVKEEKGLDFLFLAVANIVSAEQPPLVRRGRRPWPSGLRGDRGHGHGDGPRRACQPQEGVHRRSSSVKDFVMPSKANSASTSPASPAPPGE